MLAGLGLIALVAIVLFHRPLFLSNWGVVEPGQIYRSRQPGNGLADWVVTHDLQSVLNLRGGSPLDPWYVHEVETLRDVNVRFYDLPMSATRRPSRPELLRLIALFEHAPYPILIHCKSGSDRTGLASAIYRLTQTGDPVRDAHAAFTIWHGHVPIGGPEHLHEPLIEYQGWLDRQGLAHQPSRFLRFVEEHYRDPDHPPGTSDISAPEPGDRWPDQAWDRARDIRAASGPRPTPRR